MAWLCQDHTYILNSERSTKRPAHPADSSRTPHRHHHGHKRSTIHREPAEASRCFYPYIWIIRVSWSNPASVTGCGLQGKRPPGDDLAGLERRMLDMQAFVRRNPVTMQQVLMSLYHAEGCARLRSPDILKDMDSRASDKIPGARVRLKRRLPEQHSSDAKPREWLALANGAVQEARTEGPALALVGRPLPYQPGRTERRSGVPNEIITSDRVPNSCTCSWAYSQGKLTLKHYNAACQVHVASISDQSL